MLDVLSSLNERCDSLILKLIMIFEKRKIKGAVQNLIFEIFFQFLESNLGRSGGQSKEQS